MVFEFLTFRAQYLVTRLVVVVDVLKDDVCVVVPAADQGIASSRRTVHRLAASRAVVRAMSLVGAVVATHVVITLALRVIRQRLSNASTSSRVGRTV